jgi:hypothetical protein
MMTPNRWTASSYVNTATALLLFVPQFGDWQTTLVPSTTVRYEALGEIGKTVARAVEPAPYGGGMLEILSFLLLDAATKLVSQSTPLDSDFSSVVDREFWNLLQ